GRAVTPARARHREVGYHAELRVHEELSPRLRPSIFRRAAKRSALCGVRQLLLSLRRIPLPASRFLLPASRFPLPASRFPLPASRVSVYIRYMKSREPGLFGAAYERESRQLPVIGEQKDIRYYASPAKSALNGPETTGMGFW